MVRGLPRGVIIFWVVILLGAAGGAGYLQYLGPLPPPAQMAAVSLPPLAKPKPTGAGTTLPAKPAAAAVPPITPQVAMMTVTGHSGTGSTLAGNTPVPGPMPALLTASASNPAWLVPQISLTGLTPMQAYAASAAPSSPAVLPSAPRIAIMVAGLGDNIAQSLAVASLLPPQVSMALVPSGAQLAATEAAARANGHETILVLPMAALLTGAPMNQNQSTLDWAMSRIQGYAGVTDAFGPDMSGGFMADANSKAWLLTNIASRGLFYVEGDTGAGPSPLTYGRTADVVIDGAAGPAAETAAFAELTGDAQAQQSALGILVDPDDASIKALADWIKSLASQDIQLTPVSALAQPPAPAISPPIKASATQ